jgi:hypothetical protein
MTAFSVELDIFVFRILVTTLWTLITYMTVGLQTDKMFSLT